MKILQVQRFFYIRGGSSRYFFDVSKLLKNNGHQVAHFSVDSPKNKESAWDKFFASYVSFRDSSLKEKIRAIERMFIGMETIRKIRIILDDFRPDIVHLHDVYHQIPPTIIWEIKKRGIPVVHTTGDYHLISPHYFMFHDNKVCEISYKRRFWKSIFHRCINGSTLASIVEVAEKYFHKVLALDDRSMDVIIAPSQFMKKKLIKYGVPRLKVVYIPHFTYLPAKKHNGDLSSRHSNYILYFGRLLKLKGVETIIKAVSGLPHINLKIAGEGPDRAYFEYIAKSRRSKNIEFLGSLDGEELFKMIDGSRFTLFPSIWNEVFGLSIIESFARKKPVIGSRMGAVPELIADGRNGLLVDPGNVIEWRKAIALLWKNEKLCSRLGNQAKKDAEMYYNPELHYPKLMRAYKLAMKVHLN